MIDSILRILEILQNSSILSVAELLGNISIIFITIYTFALGFFSRRVTLDSMTHHHSVKGDSLSLLFKNHSMRSFFIKGIELVVDNKYSVNIKSTNEEPVELASLSVVKVVMAPYSRLANDFKIPMIYEKRMFAVLELEGGRRIKAKVPRPLFKKRIRQYEPIDVSRKKHNNILYQPGDKYALHYFTEPSKMDEHIIIIHKNGYMSDSMPEIDAKTREIKAFNEIPSEVVKNYETTKQFFTDICEPFGYKFHLIELDNNDI